MFENQKNERIYKHTHLDTRKVEKLQPLMESSFRAQFGDYNEGNDPRRKAIREERALFMAEQYANRQRVAENMGVHPLNEDAEIFSNMGAISKMFESVSTPGSIIGMGEVANAQSSNSVNGGIWNPSYKAGSGDIPSYVFGLQAHIAMYCIGFDLMPTIAVDTPKVMISFVDTVYGGGTFDDVANLPTFIEIADDLLTAANIKTWGLVRATTEMIFRVSNADGALALKVRFMVKSTVKAAVTVEVLSTGTTVADGTYTVTNANSVKAVIDAVNASGVNAKLTIGATTVALTASPTVIGYASATRTNIAEATSNNNSLGGMSRAQQEKGPKHKLNVIAMDKQVEVDGIEIEADTSNIQIKDMAAMGINVIARLYNGVQNALVQTLDEVITTHLYAMGVQHMYQAKVSQGIDFSIYISAPSNVSKAYSNIDVVYKDMLGTDRRSDMGTIANSLTSAAYENQMTHNDRLLARILYLAEFIAQQNRIAGPDFIVLPGGLAAAIKKAAKYIQSPVANTLANAPELHYTGTLFETISVYKNPRIDFADPRILMGRRGNDTDPGAKFLAYDLAASRQTISPDTMAEKIRVWSRFKIADVGFYPELNYATIVAINDNNWA